MRKTLNTIILKYLSNQALHVGAVKHFRIAVCFGQQYFSEMGRFIEVSNES